MHTKGMKQKNKLTFKHRIFSFFIAYFLSSSVNSLITLAGIPPAILYFGTSFVTTAPAATIEHFPILTFSFIKTIIPSQSKFLPSSNPQCSLSLLQLVFLFLLPSAVLVYQPKPLFCQIFQLPCQKKS